MLDTPSLTFRTAEKPAVALKPLMLGEKGWDGTSCFGGDPQLPDMLDWPRDGEGRPMNFLFQIDCGSLAGIDPDMPEKGTLFFFGSCNYDSCDDEEVAHLGGTAGSCVLYWPDLVDEVPERAPPEDTQPLGKYSHMHENPWTGPLNARRGERKLAAAFPPPKGYPRMRLAVLPFDSYPESGEAGLVAALPPERGAREQVTFSVPWLPENERRRRRGANQDGDVAIPETFPAVWHTVGVTAAQVYLVMEAALIADAWYERIKRVWEAVPEALLHEIRWQLIMEDGGCAKDAFDHLFEDPAQLERFKTERQDFENYIIDRYGFEPGANYEPLDDTIIAVELLGEIHDEVKKWIKLAAKRDPFAPVPTKHAAAFRGLLGKMLRTIDEGAASLPYLKGGAARSMGKEPDSHAEIMREQLRDAVVDGTRATLRACLGREVPPGITTELLEAFSSELRWQRSLSGHDSDYETVRTLRPIQMLGYVAAAEDSVALDRAGLRTGSAEKAVLLFQRLIGRADATDGEQVMLLQLPDSKVLNFKTYGTTYKFQIARRHLRKRAFDRAYCIGENLQNDGLWRAPRVERPEPILPSERVMPSMILKPLVVGEQGMSDANYVGGKPHLPEWFDWPRDSRNRKMTFHMQIDLESLPRTLEHGGRRYAYPAFPETGTLHIFRGMSDDEGYYPEFRIFHVPDEPELLAERETPADVPEMVFDICVSKKHRVPLRRREMPTQPFDIIPYASCLTTDSSNAKPDHEEMLRHALPHEEGAVHGAVHVLAWLPNWYRLYRAERADTHSRIFGDKEKPLIELPRTYPWRWINMAVPLAWFLNEKPSSGKAATHLWPGDIKAEARAWFEKATAQDPLARVPEEVASSYRDWLSGLDAAGKKIPKEHPDEAVPSPERSWRLDLEWTFERMLRALGRLDLDSMMYHIRHGDVSDIPQTVIDADANIRRYERSYSELTSNVVSTPSPDRMFGVLPFDIASGQEDASRVMLLDLPLGWGGGGYRVRFMIAPDDLAAGRIEKAEAVVMY